MTSSLLWNETNYQNTMKCTHQKLIKEQPSRIYEPQPESYRWLSAVSECQWAGVQCNENGNVTEIALSGYGLSGTIIEEIGHLQTLYHLSLPYNGNLMGSIPPTLFGLVHTLELQYNQHSGPLTMVMDNVALSGNETTVEDDWSQSPLEILNVAGNTLTGTIPNNIETMTNLRQVSLQANQFTGTLPSASQWSQLEMFRGQDNLWTGTIPTTLLTSTKLRELDLSDNADLMGTIPSEIGLATKLQRLRLAKAQLTGTIPLQLYKCKGLRVLDLHQNLLEGTMTTEIGKLTKLRELFWHDNQFEGELPTQLNQLVSIEKLHINGNNFEGVVPQPFCDLYQDGYPLSLSVQVVADCFAEEDSISTSVPLDCPKGCCSQCCQKATGECTTKPFAILGYGNRTATPQPAN